jgi:hypothetical protein
MAYCTNGNFCLLVFQQKKMSVRAGALHVFHRPRQRGYYL